MLLSTIRSRSWLQCCRPFCQTGICGPDLRFAHGRHARRTGGRSVKSRAITGIECLVTWYRSGRIFLLQWQVAISLATRARNLAARETSPEAEVGVSCAPIPTDTTGAR